MQIEKIVLIGLTGLFLTGCATPGIISSKHDWYGYRDILKQEGKFLIEEQIKEIEQKEEFFCDQYGLISEDKLGILKRYGEPDKVGLNYYADSRTNRNLEEWVYLDLGKRVFFYADDDSYNTEKSLELKHADAIKNKKIVLGMTEQEVVLSIGRTYDKNKSVGSWGTHEQWIYSGHGRYPHFVIPYRYLYFENGILTSWQD